MPMKSSAQRGFTLIEMSIVLVIIGLIIGGILKGQEVIASARQKAIINQVNAVRAATNTYFDRYRALPGDDPTAASVIDSTNLANGGGNGVVGATATDTSALVNGTTISGFAAENYGFFNNMIAAGLLNGGQVTTGTASTGFGITALPASPITGAGLTIAYGTQSAGATATAAAKRTHWLRLHKGMTALSAAVSPRTVQNIDAATDDGLPEQGGVRGDDANCNAGAAIGERYTVSDDTVCLPVFEVTQ